MRWIIVILTATIFSCNHDKTRSDITTKGFDRYDLLEVLYHQCDTVIRVNDTVIITNTKLDTTVIETGIFAYLQYDYPLTTPRELIDFSKKAERLEKSGLKVGLEPIYKKVIDFYLEERPEQLKHYTDMNSYLQYEVNSAILCSYAYQRIGDNENALKVIQPFLANTEASSCNILKRYIELCIEEFGIVKVRSELNNSGKTIHLKKECSPEEDDWVVTIFGAEVGIGKSWETKNITIEQANNIISEMNFSELVM